MRYGLQGEAAGITHTSMYRENMEQVTTTEGQAVAVFPGSAFSLPVAGGVVGLRPVSEEEDREFLLQVYASTRAEEMARVEWDDARKAGFLKMQFSAQDTYYRDNYSSASFWVVLFDGRPCGRLSIDRWDTEIRIMDVALLPDFRNRGIGTALLSHIIEEGGRLGLPVTIHVEHYNPALRLYQRLGFVPAGENGIYLLMKWPVGQPSCEVVQEASNHA